MAPSWPRPDPKFSSDGFIDVLSNNEKESVRLKPCNPTSGYEVGHYNRERPVPVQVNDLGKKHDESSHTALQEATNRGGKVNDEESTRKDGNNNNGPTLAVKGAAWKVFETYLLDCVPVKISDYISFNQVLQSSIDAATPNNKWGCCCHARCIEDIRKLMPEEALRTVVTVQCNLHDPNDEDTHTTSTAELSSKPLSFALPENYDQPQQSRKRRKVLMNFIDDSLAVAGGKTSKEDETGIAPNGRKSPDMFMGQEDQLTVELELGDVLEQKFDSDRIGLYVAQETIFSSAEVSSDDGPNMTCNTDGTVNVHTQTFTQNRTASLQHQDADANSSPHSSPKVAQLESLTSGVVAPSLLLPSDKTRIREVNFWFAPQNSCTNYHYDEHHNILMVIHGTKTVEMAPPNAIRGAAIYSEHANHPSILRSEYLHSNSVTTLMNEIDSTKISLNGSALVVSVSAGDALFIPGGWWHRVESSGPCMAVNFWFEHHARVGDAYRQIRAVRSIQYQRPSNKHMLPFQARESVRRYFNENFDEMAICFIRSALHKMRTDPGLALHFSELDRMDNIAGAATKLKQMFHNIMHQQSSTVCQLGNHTNTLSEKEKITHLSHFLNIFLVQIDFSNGSHRLEVMNLFKNEFGHAVSDTLSGNDNNTMDKSLFASIILKLDTCACFVLSQVWEKQGGGDHVKEVQDSYVGFFANCGDEHQAAVRSYLEEEAEKFKGVIARHLVVDDLLLGGVGGRSG